MRAALLRVWSVFITIFFVQLANGLQTDLLSVRADLESFGAGVIGIVMASYYLGYSLAPLTGHWLIGRLGHARAIILASIAAAVVIVAPAYVVSPLAWACFRALSGFVLSTLYIAVESWIHDSVENEARGRVFSAYMVVQLVAMTAAQFLFGISNPRGSLPFLLAGMLFLISGLPVIRSAPVHPDSPPEPFGVLRLFRLSPLGALVTVLAGISWAIVFTFGPVYARHAGLNLGQTAMFMAAAMLGGACLQFPFGWLSDVIGRRAVLAIMSAGAIGASFLGYWSDAGVLLAKDAASFFLGGFVFTLYAIAAAHTNDLVAPQNRIAAAAGLVLLFGFGSIAGPLLSGEAIAMLGTGGYFIVLALTLCASLAATVFCR